MGLLVLSSAVLGLTNVAATLSTGLAIVMVLAFILLRGRMTRPTLLVLLFLGYNFASALIFGGINALYSDGLLTWIGNEGRIFLYFWPFLFALECVPKNTLPFASALKFVMRLLSVILVGLVFGQTYFQIEIFSSNHAAGTVSVALLIYHYFHFSQARRSVDFVFMSISFISLLGTNSRTALIAFFLAIFLISLSDKSLKSGLRAVAFGIVALFVMSAVFQTQFERLTRAATGDTFSAMVENFALAAQGQGDFEVQRAFDVSARINIEGDGNLAIRGILWGRAFREGVMSPVLGIGFGRYNDVGRVFSGVPYLFYPVSSASFESGTEFTAHNSLLHLFVELGVMGLGLFGWILVTLWRRMAVQDASHTADQDIWRKIGRACLFSLLFMSITQHSFGAPIYGLTLMLLVGIAYRMVPNKGTVAHAQDGAPRNKMSAVI